MSQRAKVVREYHADDADDADDALALAEGEMVVVVAQPTSTVWRGFVEDAPQRAGAFPAACVECLAVEEYQQEALARVRFASLVRPDRSTPRLALPLAEGDPPPSKDLSRAA